MSIKISVIIPVYNTEVFLNECIDSVINQTLREIEIICVDAGSQDSSLEILLEYASRDSRMKVYSGYGHLEAGTARNLGMAKATGEYLIFLDSDDYFDATMLEETYARIKEDGSDVLVFRSRQFDMRTSETTEMPWSLSLENCPNERCFAPEEMPKKIFNSFKNWTWNKLFKREFIENNNICFQPIQRTNDMAFVCEALVTASRISVLPKTFTTYRIGSGRSLQQSNDSSPTCFWEAYKETKRRLVSLGLYAKYQQSFLNTVLSGSVYNLRSVKSAEAYNQIVRVIQEEADEFEFDRFPSEYYYFASDYRHLRAILDGRELKKEMTASACDNDRRGLNAERFAALTAYYHSHGAKETVRKIKEVIKRKMSQ